MSIAAVRFFRLPVRSACIVALFATAGFAGLGANAARAQSFSGVGTLSGGTYSYAYGVSGSGSAVTGFSGSSSGDRAYRWTSGGMVNLGVLTGGTTSYGNGISGDGAVVVGYGSATGGSRA